MKYALEKASGDAGEFFFAYKIASVLRWPCRLFDIDIGIDAQVEIINADRTSTGRFVAFQIKATSNDTQTDVLVSAKHLAYWRALELPVFVVLVNLSTRRMYLHRVAVDRDYPTTPANSVRIVFDLKKDRFQPNSGDVIAQAAEESALAHIRRHLARVHTAAEQIRSSIADMEDAPSPTDLIDLMNERGQWKEELAQASALVHALRVGSNEYEAAEIELEGALQDLMDTMTDYSMHEDWDENGDIKRFIEERRHVL
ncbi:DUF4365 domain-containing protein [Ralstonia chuxiongensis]|uniref:DUF4365 domain-containing protein n=1 Tax=Ralstonia chuxiongensis TaxID=2957504 RepID=UPI0028F6342A|nr:DUF4365 domain-containing protein [Ralstonia chuxiongensis]CAJ0774959.1 hypothetical protein R8510_04038 [Ralstonia chuxiongensis]